jgi:hypothetical protein
MNYELRKKLEDYQRGRITWTDLGEWLDARIMFTPRCAPSVTVFHPFDPAIQLLPDGTRIAVYRQEPDAVEQHEDPELRLPPREVNSELPTTVAQRFVNRNYERPPVAWMHFADRERCISAAVKMMGQRAGGQSAVWVAAYTVPLVGGD